MVRTTEIRRLPEYINAVLPAEQPYCAALLAEVTSRVGLVEDTRHKKLIRIPVLDVSTGGLKKMLRIELPDVRNECGPTSRGRTRWPREHGPRTRRVPLQRATQF